MAGSGGVVAASSGSVKVASSGGVVGGRWQRSGNEIEIERQSCVRPIEDFRASDAHASVY